jgi:hypothetical protein
LNAAIEAACVGEEGRGFVVVANEVKKLAKQSANAALSISELVKSTQNDSMQVMDSIVKESVRHHLHIDETNFGCNQESSCGLRASGSCCTTTKRSYAEDGIGYSSIVGHDEWVAAICE